MNQFLEAHIHIKDFKYCRLSILATPPPLQSHSEKILVGQCYFVSVDKCRCWWWKEKNLEMRTKESDVQEEIGKKLEEKEKKCSDRRWLFVLRWCGASGKMANKKWAIYHSLKHISAKIRQELQVIIYSKSCHKQQRSKKQCRGNGIVRTLVAFWLSLSLSS